MLISRDRRHRLAELFTERKKYAQAAATYREVVAEHAYDLEALRKLADVLVLAEDYREALGAYIELAQRYQEQGSSLSALATYGRALKVAQRYRPEDGRISQSLEPAMASLRRDVERVRGDLADYDEAARTLEHKERVLDAVDLLEKMASLDRGNPLPYVRLAENLCRVERLEQALASFRTAAWALVRLRRYADALRVVERLLHFRKSPEDAYFAAWLYLENGGQQNGLLAIAQLQTCFEAAPDDLDVLVLLSRAFFVSGHHDKAIEVLKGTAVLAGEQHDSRLRRELVDYLTTLSPQDPQVLQLLTETVPATEGSGPVVSYRETMASITERSAVEPQPGTAPIADEISEVSVLSEAYLEPLVPPAVRRALDEAETFTALRLFSKARYALERALESEGRRVELQEKLRMVLLAMGDHDAAIEQSLDMAEQYLERGYAARCRALVSEVLELSPDHEIALDLQARLDSPEGRTVWG